MSSQGDSLQKWNGTSMYIETLHREFHGNPLDSSRGSSMFWETQENAEIDKWRVNMLWTAGRPQSGWINPSEHWDIPPTCCSSDIHE